MVAQKESILGVVKNFADANEGIHDVVDILKDAMDGIWKNRENYMNGIGRNYSWEEVKEMIGNRHKNDNAANWDHATSQRVCKFFMVKSNKQVLALVSIFYLMACSNQSDDIVVSHNRKLLMRRLTNKRSPFSHQFSTYKQAFSCCHA